MREHAMRNISSIRSWTRLLSMSERAKLFLCAMLLCVNAVHAGTQRIVCNYASATDVRMNETARMLRVPPIMGHENFFGLDDETRVLSLLDGPKGTPLNTVKWSNDEIHAELFHSTPRDTIISLKRYRHFKLDRVKGTFQTWFDYRTATGTTLTGQQVRVFAREQELKFVKVFEELRATGTCKAVKQQF